MDGEHSLSQGPHQSEGEVNFSDQRRGWQEANISGETAEILAADAKYFLHQSVSTPCLTTVKKAEGIWIEDHQGRRYMDFHGNSVHHIGYGHPRLKAAITQQMDDLPFAPRRFACEPALQLAQKLAEISPGTLSKCLFTTGGSDAIEIALKIARLTTGRFKTLSFWDSFHGAGFGASSVGGEQLFRSSQLGPLLAGGEHLPPFGCYRNFLEPSHDARQPHLPTCGKTLAEMVRYVLSKEGDIAAVVAEPNRAVPYLPPPGFWQAVRQACDDHGTLLIFDEIPTGLGKTGRMFACDHDNVVPDILVMGKALGGGILPIAAMLCRPELDVAGEFAIGHYTHEKNPVTTRAALTTIEIIEDEGLVENAAQIGAEALSRMHTMMDRFDLVGDVRGRGLLLGLELVKNRDSKEPANEIAETVLYAALDRGLSFKITMGNVLTLSPPMTITAAEMHRALDIVEECLSECASWRGNIKY